MRSNGNRTRIALALGACVTLAACGGKKDEYANNKDSAASAPAAATTPSMTDSAAGKTGAATGATTTPADKPMTDADLVGALTAANAGEVDLGKWAQTKATDPDVKTFAKTMVTDHSTMLKKVHDLGAKLNIASKPGDKTEDVVGSANDLRKDLEGKTGKDFDKAYMDKMVDEHQHDIDQLNKWATSTNNPDLKAAINEAIPKVQAHLDRAKQIKDKVNK